jgi:hypothetical protein
MPGLVAAPPPPRHRCACSAPTPAAPAPRPTEQYAEPSGRQAKLLHAKKRVVHAGRNGRREPATRAPDEAPTRANNRGSRGSTASTANCSSACQPETSEPAEEASQTRSTCAALTPVEAPKRLSASVKSQKAPASRGAADDRRQSGKLVTRAGVMMVRVHSLR